MIGRTNVDKIQIKLNELDDLLTKIDNNTNNIEQAKKILEIASSNSDEINILNQFKNKFSEIEKKEEQIINELGSLKQLLEDNHYSRYKDLIQRDGYEFFERDFKPVPETKIYQRNAEKYISFKPEYNEIPEVFVALAAMDAEGDIAKIIRLGTYVKKDSLTKKGFMLVAKTWHNTKIHYAHIVWIAFGK